MPEVYEFMCEVCGEDCDDTSYEPVCPDCYWEDLDYLDEDDD